LITYYLEQRTYSLKEKGNNLEIKEQNFVGDEMVKKEEIRL